MEFKSRKNFEPSRDFLRKWLETRKVKYFLLGQKRVSPLFSDVGVKEDRFWFRLAMSIELLAIAATIYGGMKSSPLFALIAVLIVVGLVVLDLVVAKLLHKHTAIIAYLKAESELRGYVDPDTRAESEEELKDLIKKEKAWKTFWLFILIIMAFIKIAAIFLLGAFNEMVVYYIFFALYMVVVYVHYKHTGYYLAYSGFLTIDGAERKLEKEFKAYVNAKNENRDVSQYKPKVDSGRFFTAEPLDNVPIEHEEVGHVIELYSKPAEGEEGEKKYEYLFTVKGILTDEELLYLTKGQTDKNKMKIFMTGREMQLRKVGDPRERK